MNLLYQGGWYQWIRYKTHANTEGKLMARLTEFHRQQAAEVRVDGGSNRSTTAAATAGNEKP
jgi:hypothetical protein